MSCSSGGNSKRLRLSPFVRQTISITPLRQTKCVAGLLLRGRVTFENRIFHERADMRECLLHGASRRRRHQQARKPDSSGIDVHADKAAMQLNRFQRGNARTEEGVNHQAAFGAKMLDEVAHRFSRLLAPVFVERVKAAICRRVGQRGRSGRLGKVWKSELHLIQASNNSSERLIRVMLRQKLCQ